MKLISKGREGFDVGWCRNKCIPWTLASRVVVDVQRNPPDMTDLFMPGRHPPAPGFRILSQLKDHHTIPMTQFKV